jgi:hypothetical protein
MAKPKTMTRTARKIPGRKRMTRKPATRSDVRRKTARAPHAFIVNRLREEDFASGGLRDYVQYRNLGIDKATNGMVLAHVLRFCKPCDPAVVSKRHYHAVDFQMVYVLKGWIKSEFAGQGAHVMRAGDAWIQPSRIGHAVLDYSDDCELLEIVLPADFKTVELD